MLPWTWLGKAWSGLVLGSNDQKINFQTQGVPATCDWTSALWIQQHSECVFFGLLATLFTRKFPPCFSQFSSFEILTVYPHVIFMRFQACFQLSTSVASIAFFNVIYIFVKIFLLYPKRMLVSKILTTNFTCQEGFKIFTLMWFFKVSVCLNLFLHRSHVSLGSSCFHPCLNPKTQRLRGS